MTDILPTYHVPVLLTETLELLALKSGARVIDATVGDGGHSVAILEQIGSAGRLLGFDVSPVSLDRAAERLGEDSRVSLVNANFSELAEQAERANLEAADAIVFDLGLASWQLDPPSPDGFGGASSVDSRVSLGLSFQRTEPLDMRLNPNLLRTAEQIVNRATPGELMDIFESYGDLRRSKPLVEKIRLARAQRPITTTTDLAEVIGTHDPRALAPLFQALRIAVNSELDVLSAALQQAIDRLAPNGRLVVLSYHSGEDRIVKHQLAAQRQAGQLSILTPHPIVASLEEQRANPRSRSAKLRAAGRIDHQSSPEDQHD